MNLHIDSTNNLKTIIKLDGFEHIKEYISPRQQDVFGALTEALSLTHTSLHQITSISVNPGPGSFTGIRVGLSIANSLGFALGVSVNQQPVGVAVSPDYQAPASITISKKNTSAH